MFRITCLYDKALGKGSNNQNGNLRWIFPWRGGGGGGLKFLCIENFHNQFVIKLVWSIPWQYHLSLIEEIRPTPEFKSQIIFRIFFHNNFRICCVHRIVVQWSYQHYTVWYFCPCNPHPLYLFYLFWMNIIQAKSSHNSLLCYDSRQFVKKKTSYGYDQLFVTFF